MWVTTEKKPARQQEKGWRDRKPGLDRLPERKGRRKSQGRGGRIRAVPCFLGMAHLLQLDPHPTPCPVMGHSIGPWGLPVLGAAARVQSTHLQLQAVPRSPWGLKEALGLGHLNRWQRSLQRAGPEDAQGGLWPMRCRSLQTFPGGGQTSTKWMPSWSYSVGYKTGAQGSASPHVTAL